MKIYIGNEIGEYYIDISNDDTRWFSVDSNGVFIAFTLKTLKDLHKKIGDALKETERRENARAIAMRTLDSGIDELDREIAKINKRRMDKEVQN